MIFVGTKKQAMKQLKKKKKKAAISCGMPYVNHRWLGGMLTNLELLKINQKIRNQKNERRRSIRAFNKKKKL